MAFMRTLAHRIEEDLCIYGISVIMLPSISMRSVFSPLSLMSIALEICLIFILVALNGLLSFTEMAMVSARKARLQQWANEGDELARLTLKILEDPNRFFSAIQVGITLIGVLTGVFTGATLAEELDDYLEHLPGLAEYSEWLSFGSVVIVVTYISLILGELVPKRLALRHPESFARLMVRPLQVFSWLTTPLVWFLSGSTKLVLGQIKSGANPEPPVTEEELKVLLDQGTQAGTFGEVEQDMVERVLELDQQPVGALMTHRSDIVWLNLEAAPAEVRRLLIASPHSVYPVCQGTLDKMLGVVHVKSLLSMELAGQPLDFKAALRRPLFVLETMTALEVLESVQHSFQQGQLPMVFVVDEYGSLKGVLTLNDLLAAVIGKQPGLTGKRPPLVRQNEDGSYLIEGLLAIEDFKALLGLEPWPETEEEGAYQTVGGFVMAKMGKIPGEGESFDWYQHHFEIVKMAGHRVDRIRMKWHKDSTCL